MATAPVAPVGIALSRLVILHSDNVEVALLVRGVVACFAHQVGNEFQEVRRRDPAAAMMHRADRGRIHAGDDARTRHRTDRAHRIRMRVTDAFRGKCIEHWGLCIRVTIATHHRRDVFQRDIDNVRAIRASRRDGAYT